MKILFITDNYPPEVNAPATRTYEHCREWIKSGHEVTVLTCAPNFPKGKIYSGYKNKLYSKEVSEGINIIRVWSYISANEGFLKRTIDYISFALTSFFFGCFQKIDVIIGTSPQFFVALSAMSIGIIRKKPWIMEVRDLWPESIKGVGALTDGSIFRILSFIELQCYKSCDLIIVVTESFVTEISSRGISPKKIKVVKNGANLELYKPRDKNSKLVENLRLNDKFVIGYIGTHGMAHGLDFIINAISKIESTEFHFLFLGEGSEKTKLVQLAKQLGCKNITFLDAVEKNKVPDYISITDVLLIPLKKKNLFTKVIPSKIFESASMKKPILLGVDGEARQIIEQSHAGVYFEPENEEEFIKALDAISSDRKLYHKCTAGCFELAKEYDRKKLAGEMLGFIQTII